MHGGENLLHPTKVLPPSFAGQIKRALQFRLINSIQNIEIFIA
jgi:hypothetical protein